MMLYVRIGLENSVQFINIYIYIYSYTYIMYIATFHNCLTLEA